MNPEISIIMSVYNGEKYLKYSIESILNQTYKNFEFIIIDDASTDSTLSIIRKYMKKDIKIVLIQNRKNIGLAASLNRGINIAKGKYIARQDADDISHYERLEKQFIYLDKNHQIDILGTYNNYIDINSCYIEDKKDYPNEKEHITYLFCGKAIFAHGTAMMRSTLFLELGGYNENFYYAQDAELWCRCLKSKKEINILPEILYSFRLTINDNFLKKEFTRKYVELLRKTCLNNEYNHNIIGKELYTELVNSNKKRDFYAESQYWFYITRHLIKNNHSKYLAFKYLVKSISTYDTIQHQIRKLPWFVLLCIPIRYKKYNSKKLQHFWK